jgi:tetratricopeptide (TPR) repeat protein
MEKRGEIAARRLLGALVVVATIAAFAPTLLNGFVAWDDNTYITGNMRFRGLGLENLRWMMTTDQGGLWQPLTWLSFALDYSVWGLEPAGYHLTNVLLHAVTALLFYYVCLRLFDRGLRRRDSDVVLAGAALAALFFAVHPLRVESVAWATERKGVLSGALWMTALLLRLKAIDAKASRRWFLETAALAAFALSLSAKVAGLTLPVVLLILEVYPLRRLPADPRRWLARPLRPVFISVAPYFGLAAAGFLFNGAAAATSGVLLGSSTQPGVGRAGQALYGLVFYPEKTIWPSSLAAYYPPQSWFGHWSGELVFYAAVVLITGAAIWRAARRWPAVGAAAACYVVMLAPMSGLAQHGIPHSACDRFSYLPCLGLAVLFGIVFSRKTARVLGVAWIAALGLVTWGQCGVWHDSISLWSATASRSLSGIALNNLGISLADAGRPQEATARFKEAIAAFPENPQGYDNLGVILQRSHDDKGALESFRRGLSPQASAEIQDHFGNFLVLAGGPRLPEGLSHLRAAVAMNPGSALWRVDLADALVGVGRFWEAETQYMAAIGMDPDVERAQNNWGLLLARQGRAEEAVGHYRLALRLMPERVRANHNWANVLLAAGKLDAAERHYREALRIEPGLALAQVNLGNIMVQRGDLAGAVARYRRALKSDPGLFEARANLSAVSRALGR